MILLFTDFGFHDPYVGQMHRQVCRIDPGIPVIDLFHAIPEFNVKAAAYLLPQYCPPENGAVYCCVVDPGVGGERAPIIVTVDGCKYVGPDNGLFELLMRRFKSRVERIDWRPEQLSSSFHGRDLFAPVATRLARQQHVAVSPYTPRKRPDWPDDIDEIVYIDHYGNAITGRRAITIEQTNRCCIAGSELAFAETFSSLPEGAEFWYENANGLIELAVNQDSMADRFDLKIGNRFHIK